MASAEKHPLALLSLSTNHSSDLRAANPKTAALRTAAQSNVLMKAYAPQSDVGSDSLPEAYAARFASYSSSMQQAIKRAWQPKAAGACLLGAHCTTQPNPQESRPPLPADRIDNLDLAIAIAETNTTDLAMPMSRMAPHLFAEPQLLLRLLASETNLEMILFATKATCAITGLPNPFATGHLPVLLAAARKSEQAIAKLGRVATNNP